MDWSEYSDSSEEPETLSLGLMDPAKERCLRARAAEMSQPSETSVPAFLSLISIRPRETKHQYLFRLTTYAVTKDKELRKYKKSFESILELYRIGQLNFPPEPKTAPTIESSVPTIGNVPVSFLPLGQTRRRFASPSRPVHREDMHEIFEDEENEGGGSPSKEQSPGICQWLGCVTKGIASLFHKTKKGHPS